MGFRPVTGSFRQSELTCATESHMTWTDRAVPGPAGLTSAAALTALTSLQARLGHQQHAARSDAGWRALLPRLPLLARLALSCRGPEEHAGAVTDATLLTIAALTALEVTVLRGRPVLSIAVALIQMHNSEKHRWSLPSVTSFK